jgi:hypothetical protein
VIWAGLSVGLGIALAGWFVACGIEAAGSDIKKGLRELAELCGEGD